MSIAKRLQGLAEDIRLLGTASAAKGVLAHFAGGTFHFKTSQGQVAIRGRNSDYAVLRQVFGYKQYSIASRDAEQAIRSRYEHILSNGDTPVIIDAGANIGLTALWFSKQYPRSKVFAIEPDVENFKILKKNVGSPDQIIGIEAAIGSFPGSVNLNGSDKGWAIQTERAEAGTVPVVTINDLLSNVTRGVPLIIKIDIEGFESDLFADNLEWLDLAFAVFIEPHDWLFPHRDTSKSFQRAFGERNFNLFIQGENLIYIRR